MKKIIIFLLFSYFCFAEELPKIQYEKLSFGTEETLEVMSWNIQRFPKHEETISYTANIINSVDPDLIALQEINSDSAFFSLVAQLNLLDKNNWSGFRANSDEWETNLAYLYKSDTIRVHTIKELFIGDEYSFPRYPLLMEFQFGEEKFVIINNHFKAMPGEKNNKRRQTASEKLHSFISENYPDKNVIVLGDLNDELNDEEKENVFQIFLEDAENFRFADWEIAQDENADWSYPYWKYRGHIDHILISDELFDEVESVKTIVIDRFMEGKGDARYEYLTDHRPVAIKLRIE